jgi:hypothetical protein
MYGIEERMDGYGYGLGCVQDAEYKHTSIQAYKHTNIQAYRHTSIQAYKHTGIQAYKHTAYS